MRDFFSPVKRGNRAGSCRNESDYSRRGTQISFPLLESSQADSYANTIPSFRFWSNRNNKYNSCKIETGFLCGDGARVICCLCVIQQLGFY